MVPYMPGRMVVPYRSVSSPSKPKCHLTICVPGKAHVAVLSVVGLCDQMFRVPAVSGTLLALVCSCTASPCFCPVLY